MLNEYVNQQQLGIDRELREIAQSRPRYDRASAHGRRRFRALVRSLALAPAKATPTTEGGLPKVVIRPARATDAHALTQLAEASERRFPSGLVLVAEVDAEVVAALPVDGHVLTDLWRPTGDVVQLLELRSEQLRAAKLERVA
jgi:hypothetical protein